MIKKGILRIVNIVIVLIGITFLSFSLLYLAPVTRLKRTYAAAMEMQVRFQRKPSKHREKSGDWTNLSLYNILIGLVIF